MPSDESSVVLCFSLSEGTPYEGCKRHLAKRRFGSRWRDTAKSRMSNIRATSWKISTVTGRGFQGDGMANLNAFTRLTKSSECLWVLADGYGNNLGQWTMQTLCKEKQGQEIIDDGPPSFASPRA